MRKKIIFVWAMILLGSSLYAQSEKKDSIHMFPQAKEGYIRQVIELPKTQNDADHRVELRIGKVMLVDCNQHTLWGKVQDVTLKGWGYKYVEASEINLGASTMMACPEPKSERFIALRDNLRRYNSRLPLIVYVPEGYEVRYRIWNAADKVQKAQKR